MIALLWEMRHEVKLVWELPTTITLIWSGIPIITTECFTVGNTKPLKLHSKLRYRITRGTVSQETMNSGKVHYALFNFQLSKK